MITHTIPKQSVPTICKRRIASVFVRISREITKEVYTKRLLELFSTIQSAQYKLDVLIIYFFK